MYIKSAKCHLNHHQIGGVGGGGALPWNMQLLCGVSSGVYFMHHFNELHSSHLHVFFFQIHLTANRLLVLSISILFVAFFSTFIPTLCQCPTMSGETGLDIVQSCPFTHVAQQQIIVRVVL